MSIKLSYMNKHKKIKIAILLPSLRLGGAEKLVYEELKYLQNDQRFEIQIHLLFEAGELYDDFTGLGYPIHIWNTPHKSLRLLYTCWKVARYLKKEKIRVLHCHLSYEVGPIIGVMANIKNIITTVHTDIKFNWLQRNGLKRSGVILACSGSVKKNVSSFFPVERITLLKNATRPQISNSHNNESTNVKYDLKSDDFVVLTLGRLIIAKGYEILIDAFKNVRSAYPKAVLLIGGEGSERDKLEKKIGSLGLNESVRLLGNISNVHELYQRANIYVNSSLWEGLPMTLLEAMSYGKPIIATNVGGNGELIIDGETGYLINHSDEKELESAIKMLLDDEKKREVLSDQARAYFLKNYSIDSHCKILSGVYTRAVED
jgi:glycosyltransferase involved in cell wall biosynthesis